MSKAIFNFSPRLTIFIALLIASPFVAAQVVSPVAPVWKWGKAGANDPNNTHVHDSYGQVQNFYLSRMLADFPDYYPKFAPRDQIANPGDGHTWNCDYCWDHTHQSSFSTGFAAIEKLFPPGAYYKYQTIRTGLLSAEPVCPAGYTRYADVNLPYPVRFRCVFENAQIPEKNPKDCPEEGLVGNPVNLGLKAKYQSEIDYSAGAASRLLLERYYISNGLGRRPETFGKVWWHNYDRRIVLTVNSTSETAYAYRHDGRTFLFTLQNGVWVPDSDIKNQLTRLTDGQGNPAGWQYFNQANNETEEYDAAGMLIKITAQNGQFQTLTYSDINTPVSIAPSPGLLIKITDHFGRELNFTYNTKSYISTMTDPEGGIYSYAYDYNNRLVRCPG